MNYQRLTIILIAVFMGGSLIVATLAYRHEREQREQLARQQQAIRANVGITLGAICIAADVIRHQPRTEFSNEDRVDFEQRIAAVKVFLRGATTLHCPEHEEGE